MPVYYVGATTNERAHCQECKDSARSSILLFVGMLLAVAIMLGSFYIGYVALASEQRKEQFSSAWEKFKPHNKVL